MMIAVRLLAAFAILATAIAQDIATPTTGPASLPTTPAPFPTTPAPVPTTPAPLPTTPAPTTPIPKTTPIPTTTLIPENPTTIPDNPTSSPEPTESKCISGNTAVTNADSKSTTYVKDLELNDKIMGLDEKKNLVECTVEGIANFDDYSTMFNGYTKDHIVYDKDSDAMVPHGNVGIETFEKTHNIFSSCPVIVDEEKGTSFGGIPYCGADLSWSDYIMVHRMILELVWLTGPFWWYKSTWANDDKGKSKKEMACELFFACVKSNLNDKKACQDVESFAALFFEEELTEVAKSKIRPHFPNLGADNISSDQGTALSFIRSKLPSPKGKKDEKTKSPKGKKKPMK